MKRFLSLLMAVMLVASLAVSAVAAPGDVRSPASSPLPEIEIEVVDDPAHPAEIKKVEEKSNGSEVVTVYQKTDECYDELIVTPYSGKNGMVQVISDISDGDPDYMKIAEVSKKELEAAYTEVINIRDSGGLLTSLPGIGSFASDLEAAARAAGTTVPNIYVSDLFDVTYYECIEDSAGPGNRPVRHNEADEVNDEHARVYKINVDDFVLTNFVALLHRPSDMNGQWEVVDATVDRVNNTISFKVNVIKRTVQDPEIDKNDEVNLSPFAIVVKKSGSGNGSVIPGLIGGAIVGGMIANNSGNGGSGESYTNVGTIGAVTAPKTADPMSLFAAATALTASAGALFVLGKRKH